MSPIFTETFLFICLKMLIVLQTNFIKVSCFFPFEGAGKPEHSESERNSSSTRLDSSVELVFGTFSQEVDNTWFYEAYYPILLKLPIPDWSSEGHRLNKSASKCMSDDITPNYLCPLQYHQDNLLLRMSQNTRFFKNIYISMLLFPDDKEMKEVHEKNLNCLRIKQHFTQFSSTLKQLRFYMDDLRKNCPLARDINFIEKKLSVSEEIQTAVRKGYESFTNVQQNELAKLKSEELTSNSSTATEEWKFLQMVGYTSFQNMFTLATFIDSVRWANGYSTCQANRLDIGLVPPQVLLELLEEAEKNLTRLGLGYNISIPFDSLITHYYKLPLTDCVLTIETLSEANLVLRLLVPVTRIFKHYKLVRMSKVPFFIRNTKKGGKEIGSICEIKNYHHEEMFLVEYDNTIRSDLQPVVTAIVKAPLTCGPYHVCRIPEVVHRSLVDPCVEGIITGNEEITKEKCDFKCYDVTTDQMDEFPYVIQLTSNRFAVVGATTNETKGEQVAIRCFKKSKIAVVKQNILDEATLIVLPCPCEIIVGNRSYSPQFPCNGTLEIMHVTHVIPDGTEGGFKFFEGDKTRNVENETGTNDITRSINTLAGGQDKDKEDKEKEKAKEEVEEEEEFVEDETLFNTPFADNSNDDDPHASLTTDSEHAATVVDASGGDGYRGSHAAIWVIGTCILMSNLAVLYVLYKNGLLSMDSVLLTRSM